MRQIKQFRFYNDGNPKNYPHDESINENKPFRGAFVTGTVFANFMPIVQLGIQALPGTQFYINNSPDPIIIGVTGIYELDLNNNTEITALSFNNLSMEQINSSPSGYLIVDIIWEDGKE